MATASSTSTGAPVVDGAVEPAIRAAFPFAALVGQSELQRALLLAAIDPGIGGVLISGPRGTAKSTAARAFAALLPRMANSSSPAPFVTLPLAASVEQLVGTLNLEEVLGHGRVRLQPGLLARAHHGVLYVDEVNLLPDALIDALLDVAASGINTVERDGISQQHAARFVLVGTMNPEEGELRPQLLDRFGLSVAMANPADAAQRMAIMRARLAFDEQPRASIEQHAGEQARLAAAVAAARAALPGLAWSDAVLHRAATCAMAAGVDGMRADLVMLRAARALAALEGRREVMEADVDAVAELALAHRRAAGASAPQPQPQTQTQRQAQPQPQAQAQPPANSHTAPPMTKPEQSGAPDRDISSDTSATPGTEGDWGALPARPEATTRILSVEGWHEKKA
ncbi:hypothetical protein BH11PSE9_BH11PSE9_05890 [soil metagenome]